MEKKLAKEFNNKGFDLYKKGLYQEAIEEFNKAIDLNPKYKEAIYNKALSLYLLNKFDESINEINEALKINEKYAKALNLKGLILTSLNRFYQSAIEYDKDVDISGQQEASYYFNKGIALANFDYSAAIENFKKSIEFNFDVEQSQIEINDLEKKLEDLNFKINENNLNEKSKVSIEDQQRLYHIYVISRMNTKHSEEKLNYENQIKTLNEKIQKLDDLFNDKLNNLIDNRESNLITKKNKSNINIENDFTLENTEIEKIEDISISTKIIKETFSSQENFYCNYCDNLIINATQCAKCETLYCKKCIALHLEQNSFCPSCRETFEYGNLSKIMKNILNGFNLGCPLDCGQTILYSKIFEHLKECKNKGKTYSCNSCKEKILISKENEGNVEECLDEHLDKCLEKLAKCGFCREKYPRKFIKDHMFSCDARNIQCCECKLIYSYKMEQPHNEIHCNEIKRLRLNLEIYRKKNGL